MTRVVERIGDGGCCVFGHGLGLGMRNESRMKVKHKGRRGPLNYDVEGQEDYNKDSFGGLDVTPRSW